MYYIPGKTYRQEEGGDERQQDQHGDQEPERGRHHEELLSDIAPPAASEFEEAVDGRINEVVSELKIASPVRKKEELEYWKYSPLRLGRVQTFSISGYARME